MRGYFFIYKRTLQSGNKIYYYQAYKPACGAYFRGRGEF